MSTIFIHSCSMRAAVVTTLLHDEYLNPEMVRFGEIETSVRKKLERGALAQLNSNSLVGDRFRPHPNAFVSIKTPPLPLMPKANPVRSRAMRQAHSSSSSSPFRFVFERRMETMPLGVPSSWRGKGRPDRQTNWHPARLWRPQTSITDICYGAPYLVRVDGFGRARSWRPTKLLELSWASVSMFTPRNSLDLS